MLLSAYLADENTFQCLWSFAKSKFDSNGLMNWHVDSSGNIIGSGGALDADEDMAMALLVGCEAFGADHLCKDGRSLASRIMMYEIDPNTFTPKAGDNWGGCDTTNPSYFAPGYYSKFANVTGDSNWHRVTKQLYRIIEEVNGKTSTGLLPDWTDCQGNLGASAVSSFCKDSGRDFWFDAVRSPWRLSVASAWVCDSKAKAQVDKMLHFFDQGGGASQVKTGYQVSGSALGGTDSGCFLAMASTLYVHSADSAARAAFWQALRASDPSDYFCDALRMLAIVFNTGLQTIAFAPPPPPSPPPPSPPPTPYACKSRKCVKVPSGPFSNASSCHAACFAKYSCDHVSQTCAISSYGAYAGKSACESVCRTAACGNKPYGQCGGKTWKGETCCQDGFYCKGSGYYYQCVPKTKAQVLLDRSSHSFHPRYPASALGARSLPAEVRYELHGVKSLPPIEAGDSAAGQAADV